RCVRFLCTIPPWRAAECRFSAELGYSEADVTRKNVNLVTGENLAPEYLKLNQNGTLPTLESDGKVYTSTTEGSPHQGQGRLRLH
ncbi:hypothetical protein B0H13DRAFT_1990593, partial [Mycena leptocephala]